MISIKIIGFCSLFKGKGMKTEKSSVVEVVWLSDEVMIISYFSPILMLL